MREGDNLVGRCDGGCQFACQASPSRKAEQRRGGGRLPFTRIAGFLLAFAPNLASAEAGETYHYRQGQDFAVTTSRPELPVRACSFREPVCVHAGDETAPEAILGALHDLERARKALVYALGLPPPLPDGSLGGSDAFDLYLVDEAELSDIGFTRGHTERDEPRIGELDRASAFAFLSHDLKGCARESSITRALASAIGWGIDAAESTSIRESRAAYLAELVSPCAKVTKSLIDDFQRHPERAIFNHSHDADPARSLLFPWYLDTSLGVGRPGAFPFALTAISRQKTPPGSFTWVDEPDTFDALRVSLAARREKKLSDLLLDFAVARAFVGDRDDGIHMPETRWAGASGRVRFEWAVPFTSLPRSLGPAFPIEPTGSSFIYIDLDDAPKGARITMRAEWEPPVLFRFAIVGVRKDGTEAHRLTLVGQEGPTSAMQTIEAIDDFAGLIVVATNTGDIGHARPFDPDEWPAEPHGYVVTIWGE